MTGNDLIDDYLSELMDDPGKGRPAKPAAGASGAAADTEAMPPAATPAEPAEAPLIAAAEATTAAADEAAETSPSAGDAHADAVAGAEAAAATTPSRPDESAAIAESAESAEPTPEADTVDPLAAFREGPATIGEDEFEAMLDAMQGKDASAATGADEPSALTPIAATQPVPAGDPLAAFREGSPNISDDEFEAMLDALQGAPAPVAASTESQAAPASGDPLAAFRDGSPDISDDEFEAMLDALQAAPATTAAPPAVAPAAAPPTSVIEPPRPVAPAATVAAPVARPHLAGLEPILPPAAATPGHADHALSPERRRRAEDRVTSWLRFNLARQCFAVEVLKVQEVLRVPVILPVRGTETAMLGVMNLRGQIVPVMDLAIRLGFERVDPTEASRVIVLEENGETLGLLVASVADVVNLSDGRMERISGTPSLVAADVVRGIARREGVIIILLDATRLLA